MLNPSPAAVTNPLEHAVNSCATDVAHLLEQGAPPKEIVATVKRSLYSVDKPFDTEDKEYFAYYYSELAGLAGVNVGPILNGWLYGFPLAFLLRFLGRG